MSSRSKIEWTDATWNPVRGCTRVSEGCRNCYAERMAARFSDPGQWGHGFAEMRHGRFARRGSPPPPAEPRWTGRVELVPEKLDEPLGWKRRRIVFVCSTSDLFHDAIHETELDRIFATMALAQGHVFQVLTKRSWRMREYLRGDDSRSLCESHPQSRIARVAEEVARSRGEDTSGPYWDLFLEAWPPPNVWLGVSAEDQTAWGARVPHLLATEAEVRFVSAEPLIGPILPIPSWPEVASGIGWVIVGAESGPGARRMELDWAREIVDQCRDGGVPVFVKQLCERGRRVPFDEWPADLRVREWPNLIGED